MIPGSAALFNVWTREVKNGAAQFVQRRPAASYAMGFDGIFWFVQAGRAS
jgi:hypothetical protein